MRTSAWRMLAGLTVLGALAAAGCHRGPALAEVNGTVKLNGKPLNRVIVEFLPDPDQGTSGPRSFSDCRSTFVQKLVQTLHP